MLGLFQEIVLKSTQPASTATRAAALRFSPPATGARVGEVIEWSAAGLRGTLHLQLDHRPSGTHGTLVVDVDAAAPHAQALRVESVRMVGKGAPVGGTDIAIVTQSGFREDDVIVLELGIHLASAPAFLDVTFSVPRATSGVGAQPERFTVAYRPGL